MRHRVGCAASVWYTADNRYILSTGDGDGVGRVWDASTGLLQTELYCVGVGSPAGSTFSRDGRFFACAGEEGDKPKRQKIQVWERATRRIVLTLERIAGDSTVDLVVLAMSAKGDALAVVAEKGVVTVWDVATGALKHTFRHGLAPDPQLTFAPSAPWLATASQDNFVSLWDLRTGKLRLRFEGPPSKFRVSGLAFSPDSRLLATASAFKKERSSYSFTRAGAAFVRVFSTTTGTLQHKLRTETSRVNAVAFSPDGRLLVAAEDDEGLRFWKLADPSKPREHYSAPNVRHLAFSPDGKRITMGTGSGTVRTLTTKASPRRYLHPWPDPVTAIAVFAPDDLVVTGVECDACWYLKQRLRLWDLKTGRMRKAVTVEHKHVRALAFLPGGKRLVVAGPPYNERGFPNDHISIIEPHRDRRIYVIRTPGPVEAVNVSPDGKLLVADGARLWRLPWGTLLRRLRGHRDWVQAVQFSPDGRWIATAGGRLAQRGIMGIMNRYRGDGDTGIRLWNKATGALVRTLKGHRWMVTYLAFTADSKRLYSADPATGVRIWQVSTGQLLNTLPQFGRSLTSVITKRDVKIMRVSPDGRFLAVAGRGNPEIAIYDTNLGAYRHRLNGHLGPVRSLLFTPDGKLLLSGSEDGTTLVWDMKKLRKVPIRAPN